MMMDRTKNDRPSVDRRKRLRLSQGNRVAFGLMMIAAWIGDAGRPGSHWATEAGRSNMLRIQDQTIRFDVLGFDIRPSGDWTFLQPMNEDKDLRLVFVNAKHNLITTIRPVEFKKWPPKSSSDEALKASSEQKVTIDFVLARSFQSVTDLLQLPQVSEVWTPQQYGNLTVDWFESRDTGFLSHRYGRIKTERFELLVDLLVHPGVPAGKADSAVRSLLETMRILD